MSNPFEKPQPIPSPEEPEKQATEEIVNKEEILQENPIGEQELIEIAENSIKEEVDLGETPVIEKPATVAPERTEAEASQEVKEKENIPESTKSSEEQERENYIEVCGAVGNLTGKEFKRFDRLLKDFDGRKGKLSFRKWDQEFVALAVQRYDFTKNQAHAFLERNSARPKSVSRGSVIIEDGLNEGKSHQEIRRAIDKLFREERRELLRTARDGGVPARIAITPFESRKLKEDQKVLKKYYLEVATQRKQEEEHGL